MWKDPESSLDTLLHVIARQDMEMKNDFTNFVDFLDSRILTSKTSSGSTCLHIAIDCNNIRFFNSLLKIDNKVTYKKD